MYINDGTGHFTDVSVKAGVASKSPSQGANIADVDGDGDLDIYVSNILAPSTLYENDGKGNFKDISSAAGVDLHLFGQGVGFGDINGDGQMDMYVCTWGTPPVGWPSQSNKVLINQGNYSSWIKIRPLDENGHATLLNTEVRVFEAGTRTPAAALAQTDGGSGFCSQNAYDAYFGLSSAVKKGINSFDVEIRCPSKSYGVPGKWVTKQTMPLLGGLKPNGNFIKVKCPRSSAIDSSWSAQYV